MSSCRRATASSVPAAWARCMWSPTVLICSPQLRAIPRATGWFRCLSRRMSVELCSARDNKQGEYPESSAELHLGVAAAARYGSLLATRVWESALPEVKWMVGPPSDEHLCISHATKHRNWLLCLNHCFR